jgi:23S rRNA (uracil1939-C5)-methyltransferase
MRRELTIDRLGSRGDGIANAEAGPVYVPFALPGERVAAEMEGERGRILEILQPSPDRRDPLCSHFGQCGGCAVQHLEWQHYLDWKRARIIEALSLEGIAFEPEPIRAFGAHTRRRAVFAAVKNGGTVTLGFRRALSRDLIELSECPVLLPRMEAAIPALRDCLAEILPPGEARIQVTACDNGFDINIDCGAARVRPITTTLGRAAEKLCILRITERDEPLMTIDTPKITIGGVEADLPPQAFLQASTEAEGAMAEIAIEAVGKAKKIADLYCGLGAFTFALGRKARVTAVEIDKTLLSALSVAAGRAKGRKPINTIVRNLAVEPLAPMELATYDAVLFDPPRAGALAQAKALAKSRVPIVVAVSCNPVSFVKDARALIDGGYTLKRLVPVDQFVFSSHVELVAVFTKK